MPETSAAHNAATRTSFGGLPLGFVAVYLGRFLTNVAFRLVFPFLPRIASGLGVSLGTMGTVLAVRDLAGLATPALGRAVDATGRRRAMFLGLTALSVVMVLAAAAGGVVAFGLAMLALVLAKNLYDVASSAWIGDAVPFVRRGRAIGVLETSWAAGFFLGMPLAAMLIRGGTWRTPFLATGLVCLVMAAFVAAFVPESEVRAPRVPAPSTRRTRIPWTAPLAFAAATTVALGFAHELLLVTFASWLEDEHGLSIGGLGLTAILIGLAELCGSVGTATLSDRVGQRHSVRTGAVLLIPLSLLLPLGNTSLAVALCAMAAWFLMMEFTFVSMISLFSEIDPEARGVVIGVAFAAFTIGHAAGALIGSRAYESSGIALVAGLMAASFVVAAVVTTRYVTEPGPDAPATRAESA